MGPGGVPAGFLEAMEEEALQGGGGGSGDGGRSPHCVAADEQAAIYSGWVEAALLKARCVLVGGAALQRSLLSVVALSHPHRLPALTPSARIP